MLLTSVLDAEGPDTTAGAAAFVSNKVLTDRVTGHWEARVAEWDPIWSFRARRQGESDDAVDRGAVRPISAVAKEDVVTAQTFPQIHPKLGIAGRTTGAGTKSCIFSQFSKQKFNI